jgi:hypothetical protein
MQRLKRFALLAAGAAAFAVPIASAQAATEPGYGMFADCPDKADSSAITTCVTSDITGGHLKLGSKDTPITDPLRLVAGLDTNGNTRAAHLNSTRQRIPGGLIGITGLDWLRFFYPFDALQVYAEPQAAGVPSGLASQPINLPLKVRLHNPILSSTCFIGSNTSPISLHLISGTTSPPLPNLPITGSNGTVVSNPAAPNAAFIQGVKLVDNSFAAPAAQGCDLLGFNLVVTALVNATSGLPSPAGTNEATQTGNLAISDIESIFGPDGIE